MSTPEKEPIPEEFKIWYIGQSHKELDSNCFKEWKRRGQQLCFEVAYTQGYQDASEAAYRHLSSQPSPGLREVIIRLLMEYRDRCLAGPMITASAWYDTRFAPNRYPEGGGEREKKVEAWPWVNLSVELPEPHTYVLLWVPSRQMSFMASRADRGLGMQWESQYLEEIEEGATHWRHLPGGPAPEAPYPKGYVPAGTELPGTHYSEGCGTELIFNEPPIADGKDVPEEIVQWINEKEKRIWELTSGDGDHPSNWKTGAIAMYHKMQEEKYSGIRLSIKEELERLVSELAAARNKNNDDGIEIARLLAELKKAKSGPAHGWVKVSERFPDDYASVALRRIGTKNILDNSLIDEADDEWFVYQGDRIYYDEMEWLEILPADASNNKWETRCLDAEKNLTALIEEALQKSKQLDEARGYFEKIRRGRSEFDMTGYANTYLAKYPSPTPTNKDK